MTTFSDRVLLRWAPISTLLAAGAAIGLTVAPGPYDYDNWPKPAAVRRPTSVLQVASPIDPVAATVRRLAVSHGPEPALRSQPIALASVRLPAAPAKTRRLRAPVPARYRPPSPHEVRRREAPRPAAGAWRSAPAPLPNRKAG